MNWDAIGAIGEMIGAIGVIITLIYLAYQIRQNTLQLEQNTLTAKAAAQSASNEALRENRNSVVQSEELTEIYLRGSETPDELDSSSKLRYQFLMQNVTEVVLEIYTQALVTNFSPETWHTQGVKLVDRVFSTPGGRWFWGKYSDNYPAEFRAEIDRILLQSSSGGNN